MTSCEKDLANERLVVGRWSDVENYYSIFSKQGSSKNIRDLPRCVFRDIVDLTSHIFVSVLRNDDLEGSYVNPIDNVFLAKVENACEQECQRLSGLAKRLHRMQ